jgi:hypothetical protein
VVRAGVRGGAGGALGRLDVAGTDPALLGASLVGSLAAGSTARLVWGDDPDSQVDLLVQQHKPPRLLEWQWTINGSRRRCCGWS